MYGSWSVSPLRRTGVKSVLAAGRFASVVGLVLAAGAPAAAAPSSLRKGPYLQDLGPDSVSVRLELDPPGRAEVEIEAAGPLPSEPRRVRAEGPDRPSSFQTFAVRGLQPKTAYRYRVVLLDGSDPKQVRAAGAGDGTFTTAPANGEAVPVNFLVYGDNRTDAAAHTQVVRALTTAAANGPVDFLMNTGDFVEDGSNELDWQRFFEIERPLLRDHAMFGSVGNHELVESSGAAFLRYFGASGSSSGSGSEAAPDRRRFARSVRWGELRILFLNAMDTFTSTEERKWLDAEFARTDSETGVTFRFVVLHHGPYSSGPHGNNPRLWNAGIVDLLREHRVDLVWSGHDHLYERGEAKGLKYVMSGGGGAPLYPIRKRLSTSRVVESVHHYIEAKVSGQRFDLITRRLDGSVVDRCGFSKGGSWDCDKAPSPSTASSAAPTSTPAPSPSRCGCDVPGARLDGAYAFALGIGSMVIALARRRTPLCARARARARSPSS